jgi:hypothetical protein
MPVMNVVALMVSTMMLMPRVRIDVMTSMNVGKRHIIAMPMVNASML